MSEDRWITHAELGRRDQALARNVPGPPIQGQDTPALIDCPGVMMVVERGPVIWHVECSECGLLVGVRIGDSDPTALTEHRLAVSGIPPTLLDVEMVEHPGQAGARRYLNEWVKSLPPTIPNPREDVWGQLPDFRQRPRPPVLYGPSGRGKSVLIAKAAAALVRRAPWAKTRYWSMLDFVAAARADVGQDNDRTVIEALSVPVLVLDDLGAQRDTDFIYELLQRIIDVRYSSGRPILSATNVPLERWPEVFGERVSSRLAAMTAPVKVDGPDWRQESRALRLDAA